MTAAAPDIRLARSSDLTDIETIVRLGSVEIFLTKPQLL